jgi:hypothetical protein
MNLIYVYNNKNWNEQIFFQVMIENIIRYSYLER